MRCCDQFLRVGAGPALETRFETVRCRLQHPGFGADRPVAVLETAAPVRRCLLAHRMPPILKKAVALPEQMRQRQGEKIASDVIPAPLCAGSPPCAARG